MNTTKHQPIIKSNGTTVCKCGHGDDSRFVPFYGEGAADVMRQAKSRSDFFLHLRGVATIR